MTVHSLAVAGGLATIAGVLHIEVLELDRPEKHVGDVEREAPELQTVGVVGLQDDLGAGAVAEREVGDVDREVGDVGAVARDREPERGQVLVDVGGLDHLTSEPADAGQPAREVAELHVPELGGRAGLGLAVGVGAARHVPVDRLVLVGQLQCQLRERRRYGACGRPAHDVVPVRVLEQRIGRRASGPATFGEDHGVPAGRREREPVDLHRAIGDVEGVVGRIGRRHVTVDVAPVVGERDRVPISRGDLRQRDFADTAEHRHVAAVLFRGGNRGIAGAATRQRRVLGRGLHGLRAGVADQQRCERGRRVGTLGIARQHRIGGCRADGPAG